MQDFSRESLTGGSLPPDVPLGYHSVEFCETGRQMTLIVVPRRCHLPLALRVAAWSVQLYAARSRESWGIGDLADLLGELGILERESFFEDMYELPDGSVQMYVRDPAGNLVEVDWPDVNTLDRSLFPDLKRLGDTVPQTGDALRATLYLEKAR
mgnify:CR=1 FL=1